MVAGRGQGKCQQNSTISISRGAARGNQGWDKRPEKDPSAGLKLGQPKTWPRSSFVSDGSGFEILVLVRTIPPLPSRKTVRKRGFAWAVPCSQQLLAQHSPTPNVFIPARQVSLGKNSDQFCFFRASLSQQHLIDALLLYLALGIVLHLSWPVPICQGGLSQPSKCKFPPSKGSDTESAHPKPPRSAGDGGGAAPLARCS